MPDSSQLPADLRAWLSYIEQHHAQPIALGLDRVESVKQRMQLEAPFPVIMVGGTNGKGSTCAMLEVMLTAAGYRVGCYTSPHILHYNERVKVNGIAVDDVTLCRAFERVEQVRDTTPLTYFEFGTLAAMHVFIEAHVDVAVMEIGLGGRLDAVNVFDPAVTIVTSIDIDHVDFLGGDREVIGREKAGIFRTSIPAICGDASPPDSVPSGAKRVFADYRQVQQHFGYQQEGEFWRFWNKDLRWDYLPMPKLVGEFQLSNAACAIEALLSLKSICSVDIQSIKSGLLNVQLTGRFQKICHSPDIFLDVAHNPHAALSLANNLKNNPTKGRTVAVFSMLADKDIGGVVRALRDQIDSWHISSIDHSRGATIDQMMNAIKLVSPEASIQVASTLEAALLQACQCVSENDRIVAFGSFYTVADVLRALPITETGV